MAPKRSTSEFSGAQATRLARGFVGAHLQDWGLGHECGPVLLAVSELVTNAVVHGHGRIGVDIALHDDDVVRVEVRDEGGGAAAIRPTHATGDHIGGWGLRMVESIADRWGTHRSPAQTTVWFERTITPHTT